MHRRERIDFLIPLLAMIARGDEHTLAFQDRWCLCQVPAFALVFVIKWLFRLFITRAARDREIGYHSLRFRQTFLPHVWIAQLLPWRLIINRETPIHTVFGLSLGFSFVLIDRVGFHHRFYVIFHVVLRSICRLVACINCSRDQFQLSL